MAELKITVVIGGLKRGIIAQGFSFALHCARLDDSLIGYNRKGGL